MRPWLVLSAAVAVALLAQYVLETWADQSTFVHWVQHGLLFWSGLAAGVAIAAIYRAGRPAQR